MDKLACNGDLKGCCCCDKAKWDEGVTVEWGERCPEWDADDVIQYIIVYLKVRVCVCVYF